MDRAYCYSGNKQRPQRNLPYSRWYGHKSPFYCPDQHPNSPSVITHFVEFSFRRTCYFDGLFQTKIELFILMTYLLHVVFVFPSRVIIFFTLLHYCSQLSGRRVACRTRYAISLPCLARLNWKQLALSIRPHLSLQEDTYQRNNWL